MNTNVLEDLGFTQAEIKVYLALLELGSSPAGPILNKTQLHNSVLHATLNRLVEKGFVSFVKEGKRHIYQASNPQHIVEYINEKKEEFKAILPTLLAKQAMNEKKSEVVTFRGIRGMREILYELLYAGGKEHHTIGSSVKSLMMGEAWWEQYHQKRVQKGIHAKLLFYESLKAFTAEKRYAQKTEVRYTKTGFEPLTETIIRNDKVGIILWVDKPIGILIHNKQLADSYEQYFQLLWKTGKNTSSPAPAKH